MLYTSCYMNGPKGFEQPQAVSNVQVRWTETMLIKSDDFARLTQQAFEAVEKTPKEELRGMILALEKVVDESASKSSWNLFEAEADEILNDSERSNVQGEYQRRLKVIGDLIEAMEDKLNQ